MNVIARYRQWRRERRERAMQRYYERRSGRVFWDMVCEGYEPPFSQPIDFAEGLALYETRDRFDAPNWNPE